MHLLKILSLFVNNKFWYLNVSFQFQMATSNPSGGIIQVKLPMFLENKDDIATNLNLTPNFHFTKALPTLKIKAGDRLIGLDGDLITSNKGWTNVKAMRKLRLKILHEKLKIVVISKDFFHSGFNNLQQVTIKNIKIF